MPRHRAPHGCATQPIVSTPTQRVGSRRTRSCCRLLMPALLSLLMPAALAQAINVVAPTLPPRTAGGTPAAAAPTAGAPVAAAVSPAHGHAAGAAPGHGAQGSVSPGMSTGTAPAYGSSPAHGATPAYGSAPGYGGAPSYGAPGAARAPAAPSSALAARGGYAPSVGYGGAPPANDAALAAMPVARSSAAGACRAEPSPDRQSVTLLGADALPRQHVPLGEFRVQQVIHSPDGRWAVALTKLRGQPQFAALTLDLARCAAANTVDLPAAAEDARFEADEAVLLLGGRERRVKLADARVR